MITAARPRGRAAVAGHRTGALLRAAARRTTTWMRTTGTRGVYTVWWVFVMFALFVAWGLIVDGGGKIHAKQHANFVAEEAARTAGQQVIRPLGMRGIAAWSDPITSQAAAQLYMAQYPEVKGVVITIGPTTITAVVSTVYEPKFLNMLGAGPQPVEGRAVITLNRTNTGGGLP